MKPNNGEERISGGAELQQAFVGKGEVLVSSDDKVVVDLDVNALAGGLEAFGDTAVILAGSQAAGWMVVHKYHCGGIPLQNQVDHFPGVDRAGGQGPLEEVYQINDKVTARREIKVRIRPVSGKMTVTRRIALLQQHHLDGLGVLQGYHSSDVEARRHLPATGVSPIPVHPLIAGFQAPIH